VNIVLDTNIFARDPWIRGHAFRQLIDFATRSASTLVVLEPVEEELCAQMRRKCAESVSDLSDAADSARALGISVTFPTTDGLGNTCFTDWHKHWWRELSFDGRARRHPIASDVAKEMVRRAANRIPPASASGKEVRDVVVWLSFVDALRRDPTNDACFISSNTSDFAEADRISLRSALLDDLRGHLAATQYFASLDAFLRAHADKISGLTDEWVHQRVPADEAARLVASALPSSLDSSVFSIDDFAADEDEANWYVPRRLLSEPVVHLVWNYFYAWPTNSASIELSINYSVVATAQAECVLDIRKASTVNSPPAVRTLPVYSVGYATVIAEVSDEALTLTGVEDVTLSLP